MLHWWYTCPVLKKIEFLCVLSVRSLKLEDVSNPDVIIQVFKTERKGWIELRRVRQEVQEEA